MSVLFKVIWIMVGLPLSLISEFLEHFSVLCFGKALVLGRPW